MDALATRPALDVTGSLDAKRSAKRADSELDVAAKGFEKMMVQRLLSEARRTSFGEEPSNAQSNYASMFDDAIAGLISESGTLGLADSLRRSLGDTGQLTVRQPGSQPDIGDVPIGNRAAAHGLDASTLATLRSLVEPARSEEPGIATSGAGASAANAPTEAIDDRRAEPLLALLATSATRTERGKDARRAVDPTQQREFLSRLHPHAKDTAQRLGTPTEAVLAVAALESGWGKHPITDGAGRDSHNLFGIKSHGHDGPSVTRRTTEYIGGQPRRVEAEFRSYRDAGASVQDFADFLIENPRYAPALEDAADPERFLRGLQAAGYATDPNYADKAIRVMNRVREHLAGEDL